MLQDDKTQVIDIKILSEGELPNDMKNYINDFITNKLWIFGLKDTEQDALFIPTIHKLFNLAYKYNKIECKIINEYWQDRDKLNQC